MFPLIGILIAAALLFSKRKKAPSVVNVASAKPTTAPTKVPTAKPTVKPVALPAKTPAKAATKLPTSSIQGLPLPSASQVAADMFGSMLGTNPRVLAPTLPYGYYNPDTNSAGQTPPVVVRPTPSFF